MPKPDREKTGRLHIPSWLEGARLEEAGESLYAYDPVTGDLLGSLHPDCTGMAPEAVEKFRQKIPKETWHG